MNIFIAGCARSGTSLTRGLMACFENVYAHGEYSEGEEHPASAFEQYAGRAPHIVLKRTADCHETLSQLRSDAGLLYCVRHPYDALTSTHRRTQKHRRFHVSPRRWTAEYEAFRQLRLRQPQRRIFILRYEDLILNPDGTQRRIADHFGLVPSHSFSKNPAGVEFHAASIEKWRKDPDLFGYFASFRRSFRAAIGSFCKDFGYVLPELPARKVSLKARLRNFFRPPKSEGPQRLKGNPIIRPEMLPGDDGANINGPSLIAAPEWLPSRMGKYYLYFADHGGTYIRLAYADRLEGPWSIYRQGTLKLSDAPMCRGHIASPDVHVDEGSRQIRMYFHGPLSSGPGQRSFVAVSSEGIGFTASAEVLAGPYLRCVGWNGRWLGIDMDGFFYQSKDGLTDFERNPATNPFAFQRGITLRHVALRIVGSTLAIYYTRRGDIPERIWRCFVDLTEDWTMWRIRDTELVLAPETKWEGANLPRSPSRPGPARRREHALRDPAIFVEDATAYLLYSVAGEAGIAIAALR